MSTAVKTPSSRPDAVGRARTVPSPAAERNHIVLVGFPKCGKTTVGRSLAIRLDRDFLDLDELMEAAEENSPSRDLLRDNSSVAFRARERAALRKALAHPDPAVIATGGSTFVDPTMQGWIKEQACSVFLQTPLEPLKERILASPDMRARGSRMGPDVDQTLERLLANRTPAYETADFRVRADGSRIEDIVEEVISALHLERLASSPRRGRAHQPVAARPPRPVGPVEPKTERGEQLFVGRGPVAFSIRIFREAGTWIAQEIGKSTQGSQVALISDQQLAPSTAQPLLELLQGAGRAVSLHTVPPGNPGKTLAAVSALYDSLHRTALGQGDVLVALGGTTVQDVVGFVAGTYLQGLPHIRVPMTTRSVITKSASVSARLHASFGPDLIGVTEAPAQVLIGLDQLATQSPRAHAAGLAEAVAIAAARDEAFFEALAHDAARLLAFDPEPLNLAIRKLIHMEASRATTKLTTSDSTHQRAGFGHTLAPAVLCASQGALLYGEALSLGMLIEAHWAEAEGIAQEVAGPLEEVLSTLNLPTQWREVTVDEPTLKRKSHQPGNTVRLKYLPKLGSCEPRGVPVESLLDFVGRRTS